MKNEGLLQRVLFRDRTPLLSGVYAKQSEVIPVIAPTGAPVIFLQSLSMKCNVIQFLNTKKHISLFCNKFAMEKTRLLYF